MVASAVWAVAAVGHGKVVVLGGEAWDGVGSGIRKAVGLEGKDVLGSETGMVSGSGVVHCSETSVALDPEMQKAFDSGVGSVPRSEIGRVFGSELPVTLGPGTQNRLGSELVTAPEHEEEVVEPEPETASASETVSPSPQQLYVATSHVFAHQAHH